MPERGVPQGDGDSDSAFKFPAPIKRTPTALIAEVRAAFEAELYIASLTLLLTIPDVCASLASPDGRTSAKAYTAWASEYLDLPPAPAVTFDKKRRLGKLATDMALDALDRAPFSAADLYQLRCAVNHNGSSALDATKDKTSPYHSIGVYVTPDARQLIIKYGEQDEEMRGDQGELVGRQSFDVVVSLNALINLMTDGIERFIREHPEADREQDRGVFIYQQFLDTRCWGDGKARL